MIFNITYKDNMFKLYALLWERCTMEMQNKIASRLDCDGLVYNNPIALKQAIKEHQLNYQETRYEIAILKDAFRSIFTSKQKDGNFYKTTQANLRCQWRYWNLIWGDRSFWKSK